MIRTVERADATFQVLDALRHNRRKRRQRGEFLVHGVRPVEALLGSRWPLSGVIVAHGRRRSRWAQGVLDATAAATVYDVAPELFDQLAERDEPSELIALAAVAPRLLADVEGTGPVIVLDRPNSPGNLGSLIRSADAFGAAGVVVLGHAADPYDPRAVRASIGSLFTVPVVELGGSADLEPWLRASGRRVLGLDESAQVAMTEVDRSAPVALVMGNEGRGLSAAVRTLCDDLVSIPMHAGTATSLNLAVAGSIALYELARV
jgi:TrmH family RNA methyltransferase